MKKISFLLCLSMTFNNLAIEQASAKEANSYETCFVYENNPRIYNRLLLNIL